MGEILNEDMFKYGDKKTFPIWADLMGKILLINRKLGAIGSDTEKGFMVLGQSLMECEVAGREIEGKALDIVSLSQSDKEKTALVSLKDLVRQSLEKFTDNRSKLNGQIESIRAVLAHLKELKTINEEIYRIARYLRVVALNIFIETSRSNVLSENFSIIAGDIKNLSDNILGLSKTIGGTLVDADKRFAELYAAALKGLEELDHVSVNVESAMEKAFTFTDEWLGLAEMSASAIMAKGQDINSRVGSIVMALQFHDSMRQRVEHIVTGLSDFSEFAGAGAESDSLSMLHAVLALMGDHMDHVIKDVDHTYNECQQAFNSIGECLGTIADGVAQLSGRSMTQRVNTDRSSGSLFLSSIQQLTDLRSQGLAMVSRMTDIYAMSSETTATLTDFTTEVHNISKEANIKGLNAIIAAGSMGYEGRTLAVLASEMKEMADLTDVFVKEIEVIIEKVAAIVDTSESSVENEDDLENRLDGVMRTIVQMIDSMKLMADDLHADLDGIDHIYKKIEKNLMVIPDTGQTLLDRKREFEEMLEILSPYADSRGRKQLEELGIIERYTMEKERQIHRSSLGEIQETEIVSPDGEDDDMGDNIELF